MRLLLFFILILSNTLFADEDIRSHFPSTSLANSDGFANALVDNKVNAITGNFIDYQTDLFIDGPSPLVLTRFNADNDKPGMLGTTWDFGMTCPAVVKKDKIPLPNEEGWVIITPNGTSEIKASEKRTRKGYSIAIRGSHGGAFEYEGFKSVKKGVNYSILKPKQLDGFTNCGSGRPSGKDNPLNNKITFKKTQRQFELKNGAGDVCYYQKKDKLYLMTKEWKANGTIFEYGQNPKNFYQIEAKDVLSQPYAALTFTKHDDKVVVTASNGDSVSYCFNKERAPKNCLWSVKPSNGTNSYYKYEETNSGNLIKQKIIGNTHNSSNWLKIGYYKKGTNVLTFVDNIRINDNEDQRLHRVKSLSNPYGITHEFIYPSEYNAPMCYCTDVIDAAKNQTSYDYYNNRLDQIQKFSDRGEKAQLLYRQCIGWNNEGLLISKSDRDGKGKVLRKVSYTYDNSYNIASETLEGDLSGWKQQEQFSRWYKYSEDGYNNLIAEGDEEGPTIEYEYLPFTDLLTARFVRGDTGICLREYKFYNDRRLCFQEVYDNGCSKDYNDLTGVTERIIVKRIVSHEPHILGKPTLESIYYLDNESQQEKLLKTVSFVYDEKGRAIEKNVFDSTGAFCYCLNKQYNSCGNVIWENDPHGHTIERTFDEFGKVLTQCGPDKRFVLKMQYDDIGRPISQQVCHQDGTVYASITKYNQLNQVTKQTDILGRTSSYQYDALGNCICETSVKTITGSDKTTLNAIWKEYDVFGNVTKITNNDASSVVMEYTTRGNISLKKYLDGSYEKWVYSLGGRLLCHRDRKGVSTLYQYDRLGNRTREEVIASNGESHGVTTHSYIGKRVVQTTDPLGRQYHYKYDGAGRLIEQSFAGILTKYGYDNLGRRCEESIWKEGDEKPTSISYSIYDFLDRVVEEGHKNGDGTIIKRRQYTYDCSGNKIACVCWSSDSNSAVTLTDYDVFGRPIKVVDPEGKITWTHYYQEKDSHSDFLVWSSITIDPLGRQTVQKLDGLNRLEEKIVKDPFGTMIAKELTKYDLGGRREKCVISVIEEGKETSQQIFLWKYNFLGELVEEVTAWNTPEQRIIYYAYAPGNLKTRVSKPDGNQILMTYDCKGRVEKFYDSHNTLSYGFSYDFLDRITQVEDLLKGTTITKSYDDRGNLCKENYNNIFELSLAFDPLGQICKIHYPDNSSVDYLYESIRLVAMVRNDPDGKERYRYTVQERNLFGQPLKVTLPGNAGQLGTTYDPEGRIQEIQSKHFHQKVLEKDQEYKILKMENRDSQGLWTDSFTYDANSYLDSEEGSVKGNYKYDSLGNRLESNGDVWKYNIQNQLLESEKNAYTYDLNGNLQSDGKNTYSYDALNRLIQVKNSTQTVTYSYDNLHRRMSKTVNGKEQNFAYIGVDEIGSYNPSGKFDTLRILADGLGAEIGATIAIEKDSRYYVPIHDQRGCIRSLIDGSSGEEIASYRYSAFGSLVSTTGEADLCSWQFCGKRHDPETGFTYFGLRYYDPTTSRWTTLDPQGFDEGPNGYRYVNNRPFCHLDLYGRFAFCITDFSSYCESPSSFEIDWPPDVTFDDTFEVRFMKRGLTAFGIDDYALYDGSQIFDLKDQGFIDEPNKIVTTINGVWNKYDDALENAEYLADISKVNVHGVFNATHGPEIDIYEYYKGRQYEATPPVRQLMKLWKDCFAKLPDSAIILHFCHSQGAVHTRNALLVLPPEVRERIRVIAIAPGAYIDEDLCHSVVHYRNADWYRDPVPYLDQVGAKKCQKTIVNVPSIPGAPLFDHEFMSPTYEGFITKEIKSYLRGEI